MEFEFPSVIIDLNSSQLRAGISNCDLPTVLVPTAYSKLNDSGSNGKKYAFDDDIDLHPESDIYTLFNDGVLYNWDAMPEYLNFIYKKLQVDVNKQEIPLVLAENAWTPNKSKSKALEVAFEDLEVPLFSLLKRQVCTAYSLSKPSAAVVVDVDDDFVSVTPVSNGRVLSKGIVRTKYGGNYLRLFAMEYIKSQLANGRNQDDIEDALIPRYFQGKNMKMSDSFKRYQTGKSLDDFKENILTSSLLKVDPLQKDIPRDNQLGLTRGAGPLEQKNYELPNKYTIKNIGIDQYKLAEPIFRPYEYAKWLDPVNAYGVSSDAEGVGSLIFTSMKNVGGTGEMYVNLLNNIVISGSTSYLPQMEQRIIQDLRMYVQDYSLSTYLAPDMIERAADSWIGASILTSCAVADFDHLFVTREEYLENGEGYALEKFK